LVNNHLWPGHVPPQRAEQWLHKNVNRAQKNPYPLMDHLNKRT
jgi:hypothetical protein